MSDEAAYQGVHNTTGIADARLAALAKALNETEGGDIESYKEKWLRFQERWAEVSPMAPLYSNAYVDFYTPDLYGYFANTYWSWGTAIQYATFEEPIEDDSEELVETDSEEILIED